MLLQLLLLPLRRRPLLLLLRGRRRRRAPLLLLRLLLLVLRLQLLRQLLPRLKQRWRRAMLLLLLLLVVVVVQHRASERRHLGGHVGPVLVAQLLRPRQVRGGPAHPGRHLRLGGGLKPLRLAVQPLKQLKLLLCSGQRNGAKRGQRGSATERRRGVDGAAAAAGHKARPPRAACPALPCSSLPHPPHTTRSISSSSLAAWLALCLPACLPLAPSPVRAHCLLSDDQVGTMFCARFWRSSSASSASRVFLRSSFLVWVSNL